MDDPCFNLDPTLTFTAIEIIDGNMRGILFAITTLLSLLWLLGSLFKNIGVTYFNPISMVFYILFPIFCYWMERGIITSVPQAWPVALILIVLNLYLLFMQYIQLIGSLILGKKHIFRIGHAFIVKRYTFDEIKKCSGNYSSDVITTKVSRKKVTIFTVNVQFSDGTQG